MISTSLAEKIVAATMSQSSRYPDLLGMVLCGGRATRMGGKDKGLIDFQGHTMASYAITALQDCQQTVINANRNQSRYQALFQLPVISDANADFDGPLAGLLAGLRYADKQGLSWLISIPCDAPFIDADYVQQMRQHQQQSDKKIFMAADDYRQPVFSLLHVSLLEPLAAFLRSNQKKIVIFYEQMGYERVMFATSRYFININTPEEKKRRCKE